MAGKSPSPLGQGRSETPPGPPVPPTVPRTANQKDLTRALYEDLGDVVNRHRPSPETLLMALALLRQAALGPRLRQMELEE